MHQSSVGNDADLSSILASISNRRGSISIEEFFPPISAPQPVQQVTPKFGVQTLGYSMQGLLSGERGMSDRSLLTPNLSESLWIDLSGVGEGTKLDHQPNDALRTSMSVPNGPGGMGTIAIETTPSTVIKLEPMDVDQPSCGLPVSTVTMCNQQMMNSPVYIKAEGGHFSSSCSQVPNNTAAYAAVRPSFLPLQQQLGAGTNHQHPTRDVPQPQQCLTQLTPQHSPAQQVPQYTASGNSLPPVGSMLPMTPPNSQPCSPESQQHSETPSTTPVRKTPPPPYPGAEGPLLPIPVTLSCLSPTTPSRQQVLTLGTCNKPLLPAFTPRVPRNTHPGCTTIRYNRKNNPELEKRRVHYCDFPSKYTAILWDL